MNEAMCVGTALPYISHPRPAPIVVGGSLLAAWSDDVASCPRHGDVAPTCLGEGRGKVVVPALVIVFHLGIKQRLVDG